MATSDGQKLLLRGGCATQTDYNGIDEHSNALKRLMNEKFTCHMSHTRRRHGLSSTHSGTTQEIVARTCEHRIRGAIARQNRRKKSGQDEKSSLSLCRRREIESSIP